MITLLIAAIVFIALARAIRRTAPGYELTEPGVVCWAPALLTLFFIVACSERANNGQPDPTNPLLAFRALLGAVSGYLFGWNQPRLYPRKFADPATRERVERFNAKFLAAVLAFVFLPAMRGIYPHVQDLPVTRVLFWAVLVFALFYIGRVAYAWQTWRKKNTPLG